MYDWIDIKTVAGADVAAGAATIIRTWLLGPVGWEGAAAAAVAASLVTGVAILAGIWGWI
jgi:hypothetical protein